MSKLPSLHPENVYGHTKKVRLFQQAIASHHEKCSGKKLRILDIGCGNGFAVSQFLGYAGDEVLCLDFYLPNIDFAQRNFQNNNIKFDCIDARTLSDQGKEYDFIVLADILEHLDDPKAMLDLCQGLLSDGGRIVLTVPNGYGPFEFESYIQKLPIIGAALLRAFDLVAAVMDRYVLRGRWTKMASREPTDLPYNSGSPHVQWFTLRRLRALIRNAGLEIETHRNLSLFSGPFSNYVFGPFAAICRVNARVADHLPHWMVSAWWMQLRKSPSSPSDG